jgi:hypothetical protein
MIAGFYVVDAARALKPLQTDSVSRRLFISLLRGKISFFQSRSGLSFS